MKVTSAVLNQQTRFQPLPADDRRSRASRHPSDLKGYLIAEDGSISNMLLTDLSYDGCGVRCDAFLGTGEQVRLSVLGRGVISAEVRWCSDGHAGLHFGQAEMPLKRTTKRVIERTLVEAEIQVRSQGSPTYQVKVYDATPEGCKIDDLDRLRVDEPIYIRFPGLEPVEARLCWRREFNAGLRFVHAIHPAVFELLLTRLRLRGR